MKNASRLPVIIVILIAPFAVLAFFAVRTLAVEYEALNARRAALLDERLTATAQLISLRLEQLGTEDLSSAREALISIGQGSIDDLSLNNGELTLVFKDGLRIFPPYSTMMVGQPAADLNATETHAKALLLRLSNSPFRSVAALAETSERQYMLLRCSHGPENLMVCVAIRAADVMAILRSALGVAARDIALQVFLVDPKGRRVGAVNRDPQGTVARPLSGILNGWRLEAFELGGLDTGLSRSIAEFSITAFIIMAWGFATWSLYRAATIESTEVTRRATIIAQLSHELRTPLTSLRLYLDLLDRKADDPGAVKNYAQVLNVEVSRLEKLSENAIEAGRGSMAKPQREEGIPDAALGNIIDSYRPLLTEVDCEPVLALGATVLCRYDRSGFERVAVNLLDNARKYAGGIVEIHSSISGSRLRLSVRDHGPGMSEALRRRAFEPMTRGENLSAPGYGLGLWAVKSLAEQNGGTAIAENANPGTRFIVEIEAEILKSAIPTSA